MPIQITIGPNEYAQAATADIRRGEAATQQRLAFQKQMQPILEKRLAAEHDAQITFLQNLTQTKMALYQQVDTDMLAYMEKTLDARERYKAREQRQATIEYMSAAEAKAYSFGQAMSALKTVEDTQKLRDVLAREAGEAQLRIADVVQSNAMSTEAGIRAFEQRVSVDASAQGQLLAVLQGVAPNHHIGTWAASMGGAAPATTTQPTASSKSGRTAQELGASAGGALLEGLVAGGEAVGKAVTSITDLPRAKPAEEEPIRSFLSDASRALKGQSPTKLEASPEAKSLRQKWLDRQDRTTQPATSPARMGNFMVRPEFSRTRRASPKESAPAAMEIIRSLAPGLARDEIAFGLIEARLNGDKERAADLLSQMSGEHHRVVQEVLHNTATTLLNHAEPDTAMLQLYERKLSDPEKYSPEEIKEAQEYLAAARGSPLTAEARRTVQLGYAWLGNVLEETAAYVATPTGYGARTRMALVDQPSGVAHVLSGELKALQEVAAAPEFGAAHATADLLTRGLMSAVRAGVDPTTAWGIVEKGLPPAQSPRFHEAVKQAAAARFINIAKMVKDASPEEYAQQWEARGFSIEDLEKIAGLTGAMSARGETPLDQHLSTLSEVVQGLYGPNPRFTEEQVEAALKNTAGEITFPELRQRMVPGLFGGPPETKTFLESGVSVKEVAGEGGAATVLDELSSGTTLYYQQERQRWAARMMAGITPPPQPLGGEVAPAAPLAPLSRAKTDVSALSPLVNGIAAVNNEPAGPTAEAAARAAVNELMSGFDDVSNRAIDHLGSRTQELVDSWIAQGETGESGQAEEAGVTGKWSPPKRTPSPTEAKPPSPITPPPPMGGQGGAAGLEGSPMEPGPVVQAPAYGSAPRRSLADAMYA